MLPFNRRNIWIFLCLDIAVVISSLFLSYLLKFDFEISNKYVSQIFELSIIFIFSKLSINIFYNIYSGLWRFTSLPDLINIIKANSIGTMLAIVVTLLTLNTSLIPRSIFLLDFIFSTIGFITTRTLARIYSEKIRQFKKRPFQPSNKNKTKLLLLGAGWSGEKIIREILDSNTGNYRIVGLLDDNESKLNTTIHGIQVLGKIEEIHSLTIPFDEILICLPSAKSGQMRQVVDLLYPMQSVNALLTQDQAVQYEW